MRSSILAFAIICFASLSGCAVNPVTGKKELSFIPASQEVAIGKKNYVPYQQQQGGTYSVDPELGRYVDDIGQKIAKISGRPGLPYEFVVLNNNVPNAWALPGGKIAINRGLLLLLEDEAQLAAVLAHEIVHAAGKHSVQNMQQSTILGVGVQAAGIAGKHTEYGSVLAMGANAGAGLWSAHYGRDQELEADAYGIDYMAKAGYDPYAAVELQETFVHLSHQHGKSSWLEGLFATHPPSQERVAKNKVKASAIGRGGKRNKAAYQKAIGQIKKDKSAYANLDKATQAAGAKNYTQALSLINKAIKQQPEEALFHATKGQILLATNKETQASQSFSKAIAINPDYYLPHLGLGLIQKKQNKLATAKQNILNANKLLPTQTAAYHLGEIELAQDNKTGAVQYFSAAAQQGGELGQKAQAKLQALQTTAQ